MKQIVKRTLIRLRLIDLFRRVKCLTAGMRPRIFCSNALLRLQGGPDRFPIPPNGLIYLTINTPSVSDYFRGGFVTMRAMQRLLRKNRVDITGFRSVLDFGCGCGRVLREFFSVSPASLFGCDYNPKLVAWCADHLYCADFRVNAFSPPSPYNDGEFDFIYAVSVFTHLPFTVQQAWLEELHRILLPGGLLLVTLHGTKLLSKLSADEQRLLREAGYVERSLDAPGSNHFSTFHQHTCFESMASKLFTIVECSPGGQPNHPYQDLYLLRRRDNEIRLR